MQANFPLPPGSVLGLLGGGQLGRMFAQAAASMGYKVKVLEKGECPASEVSAFHIDAAYTDKKAIEELRQTTAAVTTEFENVPAEVLSALAADGACVTAPSSHAVAIAQDRIDEKDLLGKRCGRSRGTPRRVVICRRRRLLGCIAFPCNSENRPHGLRPARAREASTISPKPRQLSQNSATACASSKRSSRLQKKSR